MKIAIGIAAVIFVLFVARKIFRAIGQVNDEMERP